MRARIAQRWGVVDAIEAFFTTKSHGTGLGLPIERTIVERYGGTLRAENRTGGGAAFTFPLPLAPTAN